MELVVQFPARGSTQVLLCLFLDVLWLWHFLYSVGPHPVSSLHIYIFVVSQAFMAGAASQAGDADSSRALGLTSGLQGSVNVHRGALLLVPQWQCISYFVFYIDRVIVAVFHFYYAETGRIMVWWCPSGSPSVRPTLRPSGSPSTCFPHFSPTCFDILSWNFALALVLCTTDQKLSVAALRQFLKELCLFVNLE